MRTARFWLVVILSALPFALLLIQILEMNPNVTLSLDMDAEIEAYSGAQLFWDVGSGRMSEENSAQQAVEPGRHQYDFQVPVGVQAMRLDPLGTAGIIRIYRISISAAGWELLSWGGASGFQGWREKSQVQDFKVEGGVLSFRAVGGDPAIELSYVPSLRKPRRSASWWIGSLGGILLGIAYVLLTYRLLDLRPGARAEVQSGVATARPRDPLLPKLRGPLLFLLSAAVSGSLGYLAYQKVILPRLQPQAPIFDTNYQQTLVDRWGRPLMNKPGDLKLVVDPHALFRNFPNQQTRFFSVDSDGHRRSTGEDLTLPQAVVLGGSMAFGFGLQSDGETLVSQLNSLNTGYTFKNAAVIGYLSGQELSEMVFYSDRLHPRLYVVVDGWNELHTQLFTNLSAGEYGFNTHSLATLENRLRVEQPDDSGPPAAAPLKPGDPAVLRAILAAYTENLKKMADFARVRGATFMVAFQPQLGSKRKLSGSEEKAWALWQSAYPRTHDRFTEQYEEMVAAARTFCERQAIPFVDLNGAARFREAAEELYLDTVHLNARGHRVAAEILGEAVRKLGASGAAPAAR